MTILVTGRVVFSGPVEKLAAESPALEYRLRTTDTERARASPPGRPVSALHGAGSSRPHADVLVLSGPVSSLDALVARLVVAGVAVRELAPVVTPLEAAFLALTDASDEADVIARAACTARPGTRRCCPCYGFELTKLLTQWRIRHRAAGLPGGTRLLRRGRQLAVVPPVGHGLRSLDARHRLGRVPGRARLRVQLGAAAADLAGRR